MIRVEDVTKRYGAHTAVDHVTFTAEPGRVTGFLGPNGAGKSTTMRVIVGLTPPTTGAAHVLGRRFTDLPNPGLDVGVLLDASAQHGGRTGREILTLAQKTMGLRAGRVDEMLDLVSLTDTEAGRRVRDYSLGMRQRLGIAQALLGEPAVLILDEPANGLDPAGIRWMRDLLRSYADRGATVLLSSHLLHEIEVVADDLVVIGNGRIVAQGTKAELLASTGTHVRTRHPERLAHALHGRWCRRPPAATRPCARMPTPNESGRSPTRPASHSSSCGPRTEPGWRSSSSSSPPTPSEKASNTTRSTLTSKEQPHDQHHGRRRPSGHGPPQRHHDQRSQPTHPLDPHRRGRAAQVLRHTLRPVAARQHRPGRPGHHRCRHRLGADGGVPLQPVHPRDRHADVDHPGHHHGPVGHGRVEPAQRTDDLHPRAASWPGHGRQGRLGLPRRGGRHRRGLRRRCPRQPRWCRHGRHHPGLGPGPRRRRLLRAGNHRR